MKTTYSKILLTATLLAGLVAANPTPQGKGKVNQPISDAEWDALRSGGLKARNAAKVNQPITDAEYQALSDGGLKRRNVSEEAESSLVARDSTMNCGHLVTGSGGSNGHGKWVPVQQFANLANEFCNAYVGTDIFKGHETSDTYGCTLSNQDDNTQPGPAGNIVFAIYNTNHDGTWVVNHDDCLRALQAPLGDHAATPSSDSKLRRRDNCYGSDNNDYEGGYYKIDSVGAFGSEVYAA